MSVACKDNRNLVIHAWQVITLYTRFLFRLLRKIIFDYFYQQHEVFHSYQWQDSCLCYRIMSQLNVVFFRYFVPFKFTVFWLIEDKDLRMLRKRFFSCQKCFKRPGQRKKTFSYFLILNIEKKDATTDRRRKHQINFNKSRFNTFSAVSWSWIDHENWFIKP